MDIGNLENPRQEIEAAVEAGDLPKLLRLSGLLHGHFCPGSAMGVKAAARALTELKARSTGMEEVLAIVETNSCFADGVQIVTGCSVGNNALIYRDFGKTAVTLAYRSGEGVRLVAIPDAGPMKNNLEAAALFKKVVTDRQGTPEDDAKLRKMWIQLSFEMLDLPDEELFTINHVTVSIPPYAPIYASAICSVCGESTMEPRARVKDGKPVCLSCAGQAYYQLTGAGMTLVNA
jgi:formylmethanofuran dehydrogenase subunit E